METPFNKYLYVGFVLVGLFQGLFSKDLGSAMSSLGIALAFKPWGSKNWKEAPVWQKAILLVHLVLVLGLLVYWFGSKII
jgi:hypothetical protein